MTMNELYNRVENAITQYEQACQQEETLYSMMEDAQRDYSRYSSQMSTAEDPNERNSAARQMAAAQQRYTQCQSQLQQVKGNIDQTKRILQATKSGTADAMQSLTQKIMEISQSKSAFEQMASLPFGGAEAAEKLSYLQSRSQEYQQNLNDLGALADRIDSALNGGGTTRQKVLKR